MMPLSNSEIAARQAEIDRKYRTRTTGYSAPPVLHSTSYTGGYAIHYTGRPADRSENTPAQVVTSTGEILRSGTYGECERHLSRMGCRPTA